jgi:hypothetical protein
MALSRKFTFDKPEDSYWNNSVGGESSSGTASTSTSVSNSYNNPNRSFFNDDPVGANAVYYLFFKSNISSLNHHFLNVEKRSYTCFRIELFAG